eukprot:TRINITY_DN535_c0_g1_i1.p1 TRINITY_DN535_c0_g1~~TRINITY_DN535_c0_g1_i1.p1  ORF type:complete len:490 (-),score=139.22 TRINITY_DN535_c0_g1_i1:9-1478(-)
MSDEDINIPMSEFSGNQEFLNRDSITDNDDDENDNFLEDDSFLEDEIEENEQPKDTKEAAENTWVHWKEKQKKILLLSALPPLLQSLALTIILPSFNDIEKDLNTNETYVTLTVTIFNITNALGAVFYGPLSDYYGRKRVLFFTLPIYFIFSLLSCFSFDIWMLIFCRAIIGFVSCSTIVVSTGFIQDAFPNDKRATYISLQQIPTLLTPLYAPIIGGVLSQWLGWRSTTAFLTIACGIVILITLPLLPETLIIDKSKRKKMNLKQLFGGMTLLLRKNSKKPDYIAPTTATSGSPSFVILKCALARALSFSGILLMATLNPFLLSDNFGLSDSMIGFLSTLFGIGTIIGTLTGGKLADKAKKAYGRGGRLVIPIVCNTLMAFGFVFYGWTISFNYWLASGSTIILGYSLSAARSGLYIFANEEQPDKASTITGATMLCSFLFTLPFSTAGPTAVKYLGVQSVFMFSATCTILALIPLIRVMALHLDFRK